VVGGVKTNWYQSIERRTEVTLPGMLVVGDVTNWYQSSKGKVKFVFVALLDRG
jgi:hypothetical protein